MAFTKRIHFLSLLGVLALTAGPVWADQSEPCGDSLRLYDVRDLVALIPEKEPDEERDEELTAAERLIELLCMMNELEYDWLIEGVIAVRGADRAHIQLADHLGQVRSLYAERYEVQIVCLPTAAGEAPKLGDAVSMTAPLVYSRQVVRRREPTTIEAVTSHTYVGQLIGITGDNAVAYQPVRDVVDEGLILTVLIGAGEEGGRATPLHASGELTKVSIEKSHLDLPGRPDSPPAIDLPVVMRRSIQSSLTIEYGRLSAIAVVNGFGDAEAIVVAVSVRKLE